MEIPVLIEPVANNGFRARTGEPLPLSAEGLTREEALRRLRELFEQQLQSGAEVASLVVPVNATDNPWKAMSGMFKNDPHFDAWQQSIAEYRQEVDDDPEIP